MHVIVTGGSSGIGFEVARLYVARGASVSLIARRPDLLERAAAVLSGMGQAGRVRHAAADISDGDAIAVAISACEAEFGPCDVLVCSAGIVEPGLFDDQSARLFEQQIAINLIGTANAIRGVFGAMRARRAGRIMIVSSGAALIGIPGYAAYCAAKSGLAALGESLRAEGAPDGVTVTVCFPPDTLTPQFERELPLRPDAARALMGAAAPWKAEAVAARIVRGIDRRQAKVYFGFEITMLGLFGPIIKPFVMAWFLGRHRR